MEQNAVIKAATAELHDKGFIVARVDDLLDWARTG